MIKHSAFLFLLSLGAALAAPGQEVDYSRGIFVVNEDWYGHQNSTVNFLIPDDPAGEYWHYRVIQAENPGMELGCTNQFGAIWDDRFYLIAKQDKDPGASITGGRITVADARTLKILHQSSLIDPSGATCDGRAFIGVDAHKGYISTSNGVWVLNLDTYEVTGQVEGSANPNPANLYRAQCGSMTMAAGRVFVAHQSEGLLVIDPDADRVVTVLDMTCISETAAIGSVIKSKDGFLWLSVAKNTKGTGATLPYLVKVNPESLDTEIIPVPDGMYPPANSWYAWTPDSFCASEVSNSLYWAGGPNSWFSNQKIFRYDIDSGELSQIIDLAEDDENWKLYGCSMRLHPDSDEIYMSLYHEFVDQTYITRRYTSSGQKIEDYSMIANYWFPSLFVFPGSEGQSGAAPVAAADDGQWQYYTLSGIKIQGPPTSPGVYITRCGGETKKIIIR